MCISFLQHIIPDKWHAIEICWFSWIKILRAIARTRGTVTMFSLPILDQNKYNAQCMRFIPVRFSSILVRKHSWKLFVQSCLFAADALMLLCNKGALVTAASFYLVLLNTLEHKTMRNYSGMCACEFWVAFSYSGPETPPMDLRPWCTRERSPRDLCTL